MIRVDFVGVVAARIFRSLVLSACVGNALGVFAESESHALRVGRVVIAVMSAILFWALRERAPDRSVRAVVVVAYLSWVLFTIAMTAANGWPSGLDMALVLSCYVVYDFGAAAGVLTGLTVVAFVLIMYASGGRPIPIFALQHASGWFLSGVSMLYVVQRQSRVVREGARDLAVSAYGLAQQELQLKDAARILASDVAEAVSALGAASSQGRLEVHAAAQRLAALIGVTRRAIPPEPELPPAHLEQRLRAVRLDSFRGVLAIGFILIPLLAWRNFVFGYWTLAVINCTALAVVVATALMLQRMPAWWEAMMRWFAFAMVMITLVGIAGWYETPGSFSVPPNIATQATAIVLTAWTLGSRRFLAVVVAVEVVLAGVLYVKHPGMSFVYMVSVVVMFAGLSDRMIALPQQLMASLEDARRAAVEAIVRQRRMLGTLFHDIGNPLQLVLLALYEPVEVAPSGAPSEVPAEVAVMAARMQETLAAAIRGGGQEEFVSVRAVVRDVLLRFERVLREKGLTIEVMVPTESLVRADIAILRDSGLANLLSNAVKFSPRGGTIRLDVREGAGVVEITIADSGAGLAPDVQLALSGGGAMPSHVGTAGEGGTGLGVRLVQDYVKQMRGTVVFEAGASGGVVVRLRLPAV
jgi:signal transduction histidine kinase